jgi:hypothetical protein
MDEHTIERLTADHDARVAAIREREQKATPGPWSDRMDTLDLREFRNDDEEFVIHARQDIPFLLDDNALIGMALVNERAAREAAQARLAKVVDALVAVEYIPFTLPVSYCPWCSGRTAHAPDCQRQQALKEAQP